MSKGILEKSFTRGFTEKGSFILNKNISTRKVWFNERLEKKTRTKRKRNKEINYRLQNKKQKTSHVVSALKEKVKTNCQDPLSRRKRWQIYHRLLAWQMVMDNLESPSNGQFTSANTHQLCRGNCTGLMRESHWYQAFILFYFFFLLKTDWTILGRFLFRGVWCFWLGLVSDVSRYSFNVDLFY